MSVSRALDICGYAEIKTNIFDLASAEECLLNIATRLGRIIGGRNRNPVEVLIPIMKSEAPICSLSAQFGKDAFPFHIDTAHLMQPCRYLVFFCLEAIGTVAPTLLLDRLQFRFTNSELDDLKTGTFLVRNGGRSFYSNVISRTQNFFRWDPGCMEARDAIAKRVCNSLGRQVQLANIEAISWQAGTILIVDNWRMLHARGTFEPNQRERKLLRVSVI
ncbi:MAG: TauD/TfdA family dioxygenase [Pseudomonadota bacterium]